VTSKIPPAVLAGALLLAAPLAVFAAPRAAFDVGAPAPGIAPRRSAEERALVAIQEDALQRVQDLVARAERLPEGPAREALEQQAADIKRQAEADFLRAKSEFARARGDLGSSLLAAAGVHTDLEVCTDAWDPNDSCSTAVVILPGNYPGLSLQLFSVEEDWYKIWVERNGTLTVDLAFTNANGDIDLKLLSGCGGTQLAASQTTTDAEHISYKNANSARYFYVRVYMLNHTCNTYSMNVAITGADNISTSSTPAGWTSPIVPRTAGNSTMGSAVLPATLPGNAVGGTWLNTVTTITGPDNLSPFDSRAFLDDSLMQAYNFNDGTTPGLWYGLNNGPFTVRGGRHTIQHQADIFDVIHETNESDNAWSNQWVWSPLDVDYDVPHVRPFPPKSGTGVYRNADGAKFIRNSSFSWVIAEAPLNTFDDYDLRVYSDYTGSTSGFSALVGSSAAVNNNTDFVVGQYLSTPVTLYPAVDRFAVGGNGGDYVLDQSDARGKSSSLVSNPTVSWNPITLPANRIADVYEAYMVSGNTYYFSLRRLTGTTPLNFRLYPGSSGMVSSAGLGTAATSVTPYYQTMVYAATVTGYHPIVVYRKTGSDAGTDVSYDFEWSNSGPVDVPAVPSIATLALAGPAPNPIHARGEIRYRLPSDGRVSLAIYDVHGRLVRTLRDGADTAGDHAALWDLLTDSGERSTAGVYWARLRFEGRTLTRRIAVLP